MVEAKLHMGTELFHMRSGVYAGVFLVRTLFTSQVRSVAVWVGFMDHVKRALRMAQSYFMNDRTVLDGSHEDIHKLEHYVWIA